MGEGGEIMGQTNEVETVFDAIGNLRELVASLQASVRELADEVKNLKESAKD